MRTTIIFTLLALCTALLSQEKVLYAPKLQTAPVIDGNIADWADNWTNITYPTAGSVTNYTNARFMTGWTHDTIYFIYEVNDTTPYNMLVERPYYNDCIRILLSMDSTIELFVFPRDFVLAQRNNTALGASSDKISNGVSWKCTDSNTKYIMEFAIPYSVLSSFVKDPNEGAKIAFNTSVSDNISDTTLGSYGMTQQIYWYPDGDMSSGFIFCGYIQLVNNLNTQVKLANSNDYKLLNNTLFLNKTSNVLVYDIYGRVQLAKNNVKSIDLSNIAHGMYIIMVDNKLAFKIVR